MVTVAEVLLWSWWKKEQIQTFKTRSKPITNPTTPLRHAVIPASINLQCTCAARVTVCVSITAIQGNGLTKQRYPIQWHWLTSTSVCLFNSCKHTMGLHFIIDVLSVFVHLSTEWRHSSHLSCRKIFSSYSKGTSEGREWPQPPEQCEIHSSCGHCTTYHPQSSILGGTHSTNDSCQERKKWHY